MRRRNGKRIGSIILVIIMMINVISEVMIKAGGKEEGRGEVRNGIYVIESLVGAGKVLDIYGEETREGGKLNIWEMKGGANQVFYIDRNEDGSYAIVTGHALMHLGVKEGEKDVKQYNASFKGNYKWEINAKSKDEYEIKLKSNKLNLDVCGGKKENGTKLQLWESNNTKSQRFRLHKVDTPKNEALVKKVHNHLEDLRNESKMESVLFKGEIKEITKNMVSHFEKLKIVYIMPEVGEIEEGALSECKSIEKVGCMPKMLKGFDKSRIKTLVILEGTKILEKKDFEGLENLERVEIPESLEKIEEGTFEKCKNIRELKCNPKWFKYFNKSNVEKLDKLREEIIRNKGKKGQENIQNRIRELKEKIEILENRLTELGVNIDKKNKKDIEKLEGQELIEGLKNRVEILLKRYENKCFENESKLYMEIIKNSLKTGSKNKEYKTEELIFEGKGRNEFQTTIEEIIKADAGNQKYAKYAEDILKNIETGNFKCSKTRKKDLGSISEEISCIFKKIKDKYAINPYPVQVMTVLRLSDEILNQKNTIAEVKTGEGKSFIIAVLALVLSKYGHKVDIVTSTEELAWRDNENQRKYYELFGVKSGVLKREAKQAKNEFNLEVLDRDIVYSTNSNFEFLHLESVFEKAAKRKRKYDIVIVDEVDNMLLDQSSMPAIISEGITIRNREKIFKRIYLSRHKKEEEIIEGIKGLFNGGKVPKKAVEELHAAAISSDRLEKDKDYVVKDGEVIIIDSSTGYKKPGSRWSNYVHEMLEIKEGIKLKESSVSNSMITQKSFFNMYEHITGLTGTTGNERDKKILEETYKVKTFKMPRNKKSKQKVAYLRRENDVFGQIEKEVKSKQKEKMPVLVILPTNAMVNEFGRKYFPKAKKITGVELEEDREAIKEAGKSGHVTIATNAAGRGIDIALDEESKKGKGLHVIIPFMPENERILEQAMGRSARQGQSGSVSIYFGNQDRFYETPGFEKNYDKLLEIQNRFAEYVKKNYNWMYGRERGNQILFETEYELGSTPSEILKDSARELALRMHWIRLKSDKMEQILVATMRDILLKAWGTYFTEVSNNIHEYSDTQEIEQEYDEFIEDLEKYFPKDKKNVFEAAGYMASNEQLKMIDELAGEVLKVISFGMQLLPEPVKKVLENRVVQGLAKTSGGLTQIAAGCELCTTVVGSVQGIPMIALGTNMAFEGLQDLWYTLNGELDKESKNLIKEATGHKIDNIVELSEIGMSIYAGKVFSKKIAGKIGEESEKLGGLLKKIKKPVSSLSAKSKRLVKKFLPKRHYRKFEVVDIEELAKKQGLKPNLQLFAEEGKTALKLHDGMKVSSSTALDMAEEFLGKGYKDMGNGRFVSQDGLRQVRMGDSDITGRHGGGNHMNFEKLVKNPNKPGKMMIDENIHVYLTD